MKNFRNLCQYRIARGVAVLIVNRFEMIDIRQQQAELLFIAVRLPQTFSQAVVKMAPVSGQPGRNPTPTGG